MTQTHYIEEGDIVRYDDGFEQLTAEVIVLKEGIAEIRFIKGNRRHQRRSKEKVALDILFPIEQEDCMLIETE